MFIYLFLNMIVVPGFAAVALTNLFQILRLGFSNTRGFLENLFVLNNGNLFVVFLLNNAGGTFWTTINCSGLLFKNYFSTSIAVVTKRYIKESEGWRKDNGMLYGYGPQYAINLVITGIGFIFQ